MTRTRGSRSRWGLRAGAISVTVLLATVAILVFPMGGVAGATPTAPSAGPAFWAYGGLETFNVSWHGVSGVYVGSATYGFSSTMTEVNTSSTTYTLTENQTVGAVVNLTYCRPNCERPALTEHYSYRAWEAWNDMTNFTSAASVTLQNGTTVAALGIVSSNATAAANITESLTTVRNGSPEVVRELFASASASFSLEFSPSLGLFPLNVTPNTSWVGSAAFTGSGAWETAYLSVGPFGERGPDRVSGSLVGSGTATIQGSDRGSLMLSHRSLTQLALLLEVSPTVGTLAFRAGFDLMGGFAIIPHAIDIVQSASGATWASLAVGNTTAVPSLTDLSVGSRNTPASLVASEYTYSTAISDPDPSNSGSANMVQGTPISPAQATSTSNCLQGTASCSTASVSPASPAVGGQGVFGLVLVGLGIVAIAVIVGGLVISQRRRIPPPSYPNARLYPPGASVARPSEPDGPEPPSDEDDPLQNLW